MRPRRRRLLWLLPLALITALVIWFWPLLSVLFPYAFQSKRSYQATCVDNLKNIGQAMSLYYEAEGAYPPAEKWMDGIAPYLHAADMDPSEQTKKLRCPDVMSGYGYAFNAAAHSKAEDVPLVYDSEKLERNALDSMPLASLPKKPRTSGNNILWADGHVR